MEIPRQRDDEAAVLERALSNYALGASQSVRARFELYEFGDPYEDIDKTAIESLRNIGKLATTATVLDIGAADGRLLDRLRVEYGHTGKLMGIDPHPIQFLEHKDYNQLLISYKEWQWLGEVARRKGLDINLPRLGILQSLGYVRPNVPDKGIQLREGFAEDLAKVRDSSVDALFAMFMLYHLGREQRMDAFHNFARVLRPQGAFALATSDTDNKLRHRELENDIADYLGISPPPPMNAGFTTDKMLAEVPQHFKHLYIHDYKAAMHIHTKLRVFKYRLSLHSLRTLFNPVPTAQAFEEAIEAKVMPVMRREANNTGAFRDVIHRSLGIASQEALAISEELHFRQVA